MIVQEVTRTMLNDAKLHDGYWREVVYTVVYVQNRGQLKVNSDKTPYELWFGRPASIEYFRVFVSKCYIKRDDDNLGNFDSRIDEGIFLGYYSIKRKYICYNIRLHKIIESENVTIYDTDLRRIQIQESVDDEETDEEEIDEDSQKHETLEQ